MRTNGLRAWATLTCIVAVAGLTAVGCGDDDGRPPVGTDGGVGADSGGGGTDGGGGDAGDRDAGTMMMVDSGGMTMTDAGGMTMTDAGGMTMTDAGRDAGGMVMTDAGPGIDAGRDAGPPPDAGRDAGPMGLCTGVDCSAMDGLCVIGVCNPATGACGTSNRADGTACTDTSMCTTATTCTAGVCGGGSATVCNDSNPCTTDTCAPATGCVYTNNTIACDDGNACTTGTICGGGTCGGGSAVTCNDSNVCTTDTCAPATGCVYTNNTIACDDANACTTGTVCGGGTCGGGSAVTCSDGNLCTTDTCAPATGCVYTNNMVACDDGNACTMGELCGGGSCGTGTPVIVPGETCAAPVAIPGTDGLHTVMGSTACGANDYAGTCSGSGAADVVYSITLAGSRRVRFETSGYDTVLYVRSGACGAGTELGCNDDFMGVGGSRVILDLAPGTYYVFVDGFGTNRGAFTLLADVTQGRASCAAIHTAEPAAPSGAYDIQPTLAGPFYRVYCDMTTDRGGWTLVGSTRTTTRNDESSAYYADLATLSPAAGHTGIWNGLRSLYSAAADVRFSCRRNPAAVAHDVDLAFYNVNWYGEITNGTDALSCFQEDNGLGYDRPAPGRRDLVAATARAVNDDWNTGYLEGEDTCAATDDFSVDLDDRGMDSNQSDGTDWGEDDGALKCGTSGIADGDWFVWVRGATVPPSATYPTAAATACNTSGTCGALGVGGGGTYFRTGDYVQESVRFAGLTTLRALTLTFDMDDLTAGCAVGATHSFNVLVNGTVVGTYSFVTPAAPAGRRTFNQAYSFAPIAGTGGTADNYTIRLIATTTVCPGGSSWNWFSGGTARGL